MMFHCGKKHWALVSGCLIIPLQFSWMLCQCFYGIRLLTVHVASQGDRKAAEVYATWPWLTVYWTRTLTPSEQEVWPSREPCSEKDKTEEEVDEICMKTVSILAPSSVCLVNPERFFFSVIINSCHGYKVALVTPCLNGAKQIREGFILFGDITKESFCEHLSVNVKYSFRIKFSCSLVCNLRIWT